LQASKESRKQSERNQQIITNRKSMSYAPMESEAVTQTKALNNQSTPLSFQSRSSVRIPGSRAPRKNGHTPKWDGSAHFPIIVHCHLCWDWVWQRPQQFLSRLSAKHKILFVETVRPDDSLITPLAQMRTAENCPNITILRIQFPGWRWNDGKFVDKERRRIVQEAIQGPLKGQFDNPVQWFYDPMAVTAFAGQMGEIATVYDCMDELSKFRGAPPEILTRESELLTRADVVFTGGRKLWESKRQQNQNCHFYGCGVDIEHFGKARLEQTEIPEDLRSVRKPVLGFFGVVDERMDYELIAKLADANPEWSVVIIGPRTKVEESALPKRSNIHWLGGRDYSQLPNYCKGFDVCLMPFALNESTEYINPTKSLEYVATGRPIVSSAVADVVRNFGSVVQIANSHQEFIELCQQTLAKADDERVKRGLQMVGENSWESIVAKLEGHIVDALTANHGVTA
jgi:glycosyltransferase involved in cell wall biosynthesis